MTNPFGGQAGDPTAMFAKLERLQEQAEAMLKGLEDALGDLGAKQAEAVSEDGLVRVVLDEGGAVETVEISDSAMGNLSRLNRSIMQAISQARIVHSAMMVELVDKLGDVDPFGLAAKLRAEMPGEVGQTLRDRADERRRGY
ncbi:MAG TPA: YbaB/EbfC family nucleoid-associated protein [Phytomonospora sp.]